MKEPEKNQEEDQPQLSPHFLFFMDGMAHFREKETDCCIYFHQRCMKCDGIGHYQPVYGGYYYKCEDCLHEW